jgi:hypothetical protein
MYHQFYLTTIFSCNFDIYVQFTVPFSALVVRALVSTPDDFFRDMRRDRVTMFNLARNIFTVIICKINCKGQGVFVGNLIILASARTHNSGSPLFCDNSKFKFLNLSQNYALLSYYFGEIYFKLKLIIWRDESVCC